MSQNHLVRKVPKARLSVTTLEDRTVPYAISGSVFYDANSDGMQDAVENTVQRALEGRREM